MAAGCGPGPGFTFLLGATPYPLPQAQWTQLQDNGVLLREFMHTTINLFRASLAGDANPQIAELLLNEVPRSLGREYHLALRDEHWSSPDFFRTDESLTGHVLEIQCPGSSWGELAAAERLFAASSEGPDPLTGEFIRQLQHVAGPDPRVIHLEDNASAPYGVRYFKQVTTPSVRYFGLARGLGSLECNYVRSHSFQGMMAENYAPIRLRLCAQGACRFDLPPHVTFDQKAPLALPFWSVTRDSYSDDTRSLFPFTSLLINGVYEDEDGVRQQVSQLLRQPVSRRKYYLKYAGSDVTLNWGSRAVYAIARGGAQSRAQVTETARRASHAHPWLLQADQRSRSSITFHRPDGEIHSATWPGKLSGYYGPQGVMSASVMHRRHTKVHGQFDTVFSSVTRP
jgi:hypothetical protein